MTWTSPNIQLSWFHKIILYLMKFGPIPSHVAFIMDGNRRYAMQKTLHKTSGHLKGFSKLSETLHWCKELGIREVSVYAFSIENFRREQEEVDFLLDLAEEKLVDLLKDSDKLLEENVGIRVLGNLRLLPTNLQRLCSELMLLTRHNKKSILNIFLAYTSRDEITSAVEKVYRGVQQEFIIPSDIDTDLLSSCLYTRDCRPLDLLVRTSGEVRLSDFLVWQAGRDGAVYRFVDSFWPDFSLNDFLSVLLHYQLTVTGLASLCPPPSREKPSAEPVCECSSSTSAASRQPSDHTRQCRVDSFLEHLDREYWCELEKMRLYSDPTTCHPSASSSESRVSQRSVGDSAFT